MADTHREVAVRMKAPFDGKPELFGGVSNEDRLARECPDQFNRHNPWSEYASRCFFCGADISAWKYKSTDDAERIHQRACFRALLAGFGLKHQAKEAVGGWMLSEMLAEVPQYIAPKKKEQR